MMSIRIRNIILITLVAAEMGKLLFLMTQTGKLKLFPLNCWPIKLTSHLSKNKLNSCQNLVTSIFKKR